MRTLASVFCILAIIAISNAFPAPDNSDTITQEIPKISIPVVDLKTTQTSLLAVDHPASRDGSEDELKRSARALGLLGLGFGGFGGLGNKFGGLGGLGGFGHGLGGGLGGSLLSFKKPFLFNGGF